MSVKTTLFYLMYKEFYSIQEQIELSTDKYNLLQNIAILSRTNNPIDDAYLILSNDETVNTIIKENGGKEAPENDPYKLRIKEGKTSYKFLFGNEKLIKSL